MQTPDEQRELEEVIDRLTKKFPTASQDRGHGRARGTHRQPHSRLRTGARREGREEAIEGIAPDPDLT